MRRERESDEGRGRESLRAFLRMSMDESVGE